MKNQELISLIEAEWDLDDGFFGKLRNGHFDHIAYQRCKQSLERVQREVGKSETISRRLVSLIWYIPLFMTWQADRIGHETNSCTYEDVSNEIQSIVQAILWVP
ncbi:MAG: hypothetical protein U0640_12180 [Phycisphaerales bacterium]